MARDDIEWGQPRPPKPKPLTEAQIPGMTRRELYDLVEPAVEYYQRSPRWPHLPADQEAQYDAFWRIFHRYFRPEDIVGAALAYVQVGRDDYWQEPAIPIQPAST
jgi:hypothetical protein